MAGSTPKLWTALITALAACSNSGDARRSEDSDGGDGTQAADGGSAGAPDGAPRGTQCPLPPPSSGSFLLRRDQLGYLPGDAFRTVAVGSGASPASFRVFDLGSGCEVGHGPGGARLLDTTSQAGTPLTGDRIDLSSVLRTAGSYEVVLEDGSTSGPIRVGADVYASVLPKVVTYLRIQRCGPTTTAVSRHGACHLHASLAAAHSGDAIPEDDRYTGTVSNDGTGVDVEGGWHDAGDYVKFLGTASYVLAVDLMALRDHAAVLDSAAAGHVYNDLRDEMRWGLDWVVKMVAGAELYHQVSGSRDHDAAFRPPEADTKSPVTGYDQRPVFRFKDGAGGNLLGRAAAALALGSQVFGKSDPAYAAKLLGIAKSVYQAAASRTNTQSSDPSSYYSDDSVDDDLALGAAAIARATGDASARSEAIQRARTAASGATPGTPLGWGDVTSLALLETAGAFGPGAPETAEMSSALSAIAAPFLSTDSGPVGVGGAFGYALPTFGNGSTAESLGAAAVCLAARRLHKTAASDHVARAQLHWLFGQNPFGISFMVGMGDSFPQHPHSSLALSTQIVLSGAVVGGPSALSNITSDSSLRAPSASSPFAKFSTPDAVYDDDPADYVLNEPAIDFSAALVFTIADLLDPPP